MSDHDSTIYLAAIIDLQKGVQKVDTTFYMYFHYDKELAKSRKPNICQAMFSSVNILVCDMVTNEPCKNSILNQQIRFGGFLYPTRIQVKNNEGKAFMRHE